MAGNVVKMRQRFLSAAEIDVVFAKAARIKARERVRREELALYSLPLWRFIRRGRQASRLLDAQVALCAAENAVREAGARRSAARGGA
jgi:hypothetical protein